MPLLRLQKDLHSSLVSNLAPSSQFTPLRSLQCSWIPSCGILLVGPHGVLRERLAPFLKPAPFSPADCFFFSIWSLCWVEECLPKFLPFLDLRM